MILLDLKSLLLHDGFGSSFREMSFLNEDLNFSPAVGRLIYKCFTDLKSFRLLIRFPNFLSVWREVTFILILLRYRCAHLGVFHTGTVEAGRGLLTFSNTLCARKFRVNLKKNLLSNCKFILELLILTLAFISAETFGFPDSLIFRDFNAILGCESFLISMVVDGSDIMTRGRPCKQT